MDAPELGSFFISRVINIFHTWHVASPMAQNQTPKCSFYQTHHKGKNHAHTKHPYVEHPQV